MRIVPRVVGEDEYVNVHFTAGTGTYFSPRELAKDVMFYMSIEREELIEAANRGMQREYEFRA